MQEFLFELVALVFILVEARLVILQHRTVQDLVPPPQALIVILSLRGETQMRQLAIQPGWFEDAGAGRRSPGKPVCVLPGLQVRDHRAGRLADPYRSKAGVHANIRPTQTSTW